jgi:energy-coupling factor transport system substrate-specific component
MKARDIALIGLLSASVTGGKLALSFLPNVEIVTLLFIVYTVAFGFKRTLLVSFIFTTTEIFIYGFATWLLVYYFIWPLLILITTIIKKHARTEYGYAAIAGMFGLSFGAIFAISESFFYGIAYGFTYWLRGVPFDILHGVSNFILALLLFKPLVSVSIKGREILER